MKLTIELDFDSKKQLNSFKKEFKKHFGITKESMQRIISFQKNNLMFFKSKHKPNNIN